MFSQSFSTATLRLSPPTFPFSVLDSVSESHLYCSYLQSSCVLLLELSSVSIGPQQRKLPQHDSSVGLPYHNSAIYDAVSILAFTQCRRYDYRPSASSLPETASSTFSIVGTTGAVSLGLRLGSIGADLHFLIQKSAEVKCTAPLGNIVVRSLACAVACWPG